MTDTVMKLAALATLILSLGTLAWFVPEWHLIVVLTLATAMAAYDFFLRPRGPGNGGAGGA